MIAARRSEQFAVISVHEPGFQKLDPEVIRRYQLDRDFSALSEMDPRPTVFHCDPLLPEDDRRIDPNRLDADEVRYLFRKYVKRVENFDDERGRPCLKWESVSDVKMVTKDSVDKVPRDVMQEVVMVVIQMANQSTVPFTPQDISAEIVRTRALQLLVPSANTKIVKSDGSKSGQDSTPE